MFSHTLVHTYYLDVFIGTSTTPPRQEMSKFYISTMYEE